MKRSPLPIAIAILIAALLVAALLALGGDPQGRTLARSLGLGAAFGLALQRSRFCFLCHTRDLLEHRDGRGVIAILVALAVGALGYLIVLGAWMPVPLAERLPPTAHVGPVGPALALAAFAFGLGMAISGSCISAHLYRLGEGSPTAPFALVGSAAGFALGFVTWNGLYLGSISESPVIWLPHTLGYAGTLLLTFALLALFAYLALRYGAIRLPARRAGPLDLKRLAQLVLVERWPASLGGALVGVLSAVAYLRVAPLGVTAELGSLARTGADQLGLLPSTLHALDGFRGCVTAVKTALMTPNGLFVGGLVAASLAAALVSGEFAPRLPKAAEIGRGLLGGVLMGWGAMIALGCTVGVLLSGIHAGALSGWVFLVFSFGGVALGLWMRRRYAW
jgi:uncharacterized membrane protein YedE/YeeE